MIVTDSTYDWLTWGLMDCPHGRLSPDLLARMEVHRTRAASLPLAAARLPIGWSYDSTLRRRSTADGVHLRSTWRRVSRFIVNHQRIDLEAFGGIGGGPGFGFRDVRIYVDDELVGRAWSGGCALGFGGSSGRCGGAVARRLCRSRDCPERVVGSRVGTRGSAGAHGRRRGAGRPHWVAQAEGIELTREARARALYAAKPKRRDLLSYVRVAPWRAASKPRALLSHWQPQQEYGRRLPPSAR